MIRPIDLINKLYPLEDELKNILLVHSRSVTRKALDIAENILSYNSILSSLPRLLCCTTSESG
jgi:hypothetical protein